MSTPLAVTRELGYATSSPTNWWAAPDEEQTPELRWPQSVRVYDAMARQDSQPASVLRAVSFPVRRTGWRIAPGRADDPVVQYIAEELGLPIKGQEAQPPDRARDRFSWSEHLRYALLALRYGHQFFEQSYRLDGGDYRLRKLAPRPARTISKITVALDGGLQSIEQHAPSTLLRPLRTAAGPITIPVSRLVAYVHEAEPGSWVGTSLLRPAYKFWLLKDRVLRVGAMSVERNGMGLPTYTAGSEDEDLTAGQDIATRARAGDNAGAALPFGAELHLRGVEGALPDALAWVRYYDEQTAAAVLAHALNLGQQKGTGSYALGATFLDFFVLALQTVAEWFRDVAQQHVIEDLVDLQFGPDTTPPRLEFDEIGADEAALAQAINLLLQSGALRADPDLEEHLRQLFRLPPKSPRRSGAGEEDA